jgi:DNA-binding SARP family transcriptional activator
MTASPLPSAPSVAASARIQLCGSLFAEIDGERVDTTLPGRKGRLLFACLVIAGGRPMSRDELIDIIWPESSPADPDGTFSTLLTRLRNAIGHERVLGRAELSLDLGDAWVDWEVARAGAPAAEALLAAGDAGEAIELAAAGLEIARRPLLPGIATPWIEARRRELDELATALLDVGGRAALALGGQFVPTAERYARELIDREPYRESGYQLLMETHAARGNVAEALRVYDDLRRLLREELGLAPAAAVTAVARRLLQSQDTQPSLPAVPAAAAGVPLPPPLAQTCGRPLVGRGADVQELAAAIEGVAPGSYRMFVVSGAAGAGKTRLAAAVGERVHGLGATVLYGRAQRDATMPCRPLVEALRRHLGHDDAVAHQLAPTLAAELAELGRGVPELRRAVAPRPDDVPCAAELSRTRVFDAIGALLEALAQQAPLLLVLDDLQWADAETCALLRHIAHGAYGARLALLLCVRDDEPMHPCLRALLLDVHRERMLAHCSLAPLSLSETAELIRSHRGRAAEPGELAAIFADSAGNPFRIEELLGGNATHPLLGLP